MAKTKQEKEFEKLFGVTLPDDYELEVKVHDLKEKTTQTVREFRELGFLKHRDSDHCGSSTSSTLTMEFFVAISQDRWAI